MFRMIIAVLAVLLVGCSSTAPYVSNHVVVTGGITDLGAGREAAILELCILKERADEATIAALRKDPSKADCDKREFHYALGTSIARDIAAGAVPVVMGAVIQGEYAKDITDKQIKACGEGGCGGGGAIAIANSVAAAEAGAKVSASGLATCPTGNCAVPPAQ